MLPIIITETFLTTKNSQSVQTQNQSLLTLHGHRFYVSFFFRGVGGCEETRGGNERRDWSQEEEVMEQIEGRIGYLFKNPS